MLATDPLMKMRRPRVAAGPGVNVRRRCPQAGPADELWTVEPTPDEAGDAPALRCAQRAIIGEGWGREHTPSGAPGSAATASSYLAGAVTTAGNAKVDTVGAAANAGISAPCAGATTSGGSKLGLGAGLCNRNLVAIQHYPQGSEPRDGWACPIRRGGILGRAPVPRSSGPRARPDPGPGTRSPVTSRGFPPLLTPGDAG